MTYSYTTLWDVTSIPDVVVAASLYGYVYASEDGGDSWRKLQKEFGEIRSVALTPS